MEEIDVPRYFLCPISLQIMKDPVTTTTGITYDRESIEQWLSTESTERMCPVTKQLLLPRSENYSDLTPNITLRRLIQGWCIANAKHGVDRIPTPKSPLNSSLVYKLLRDLNAQGSQLNSLKRLESLAMENDQKNRRCLLESGVVKAMIHYVIRCYKEKTFLGLESSLRILQKIWNPHSVPEAAATEAAKVVVCENWEFVESLTWFLNQRDDFDSDFGVRSGLVIHVMRNVFRVASSSLKERLNSDFFRGMINILRHQKTSKQTIKSALRTLVDVCQFGRNKFRMIDSNLIHELIELEWGMITQPAEKKITELVLCILAYLCTCADGRAQFLGHSGGIPIVSKRILRVSPTADDRAVQIFTMITKYSSTSDILQEMLRVGAVSKLCMVLQIDSAKYLKDRAREILRTHCNVWKSSPCIQLYVVTR